MRIDDRGSRRINVMVRASVDDHAYADLPPKFITRADATNALR
jgi:hypothetical protein